MGFEWERGKDAGGVRHGGEGVDVVDGFDGGRIVLLRVGVGWEFHGCHLRLLRAVWEGFVSLPEFGGEEAAEGVVDGEGEVAGGAEGAGVVWEAGGLEAGEDAEGEVERTDEEMGWQAGGADGDAEVGEEPEGVGGEVRGGGGEEAAEVGFGKAVEEEVRDDEVEGWEGLRAVVEVGEGVGAMEVEAAVGGGWAGLLTSAVEEVEHLGAEVDGVGSEEVGGVLEEMGEEAAVAVAEGEDAPGVEDLREVVEAGAGEGGAEAEALEEVVGAGDAVEVGVGHVF